MKHLVRLLGLFTLAASLLPAQSLSPADRAKAVGYLEKTRAAVLAATAGLAEAQWKFKPAPDRWSVADVLEHLASTEDMLFGMVKGKVMSAPPRPEGEDVKAIDEFVLQTIPDRTNKAQAPESLAPKNRFGSPADSRKHFQESRTKTLAFLRETPDLREHAVDSPLGKRLDAYQWILFIGAHSERHTKQIEEVKSDPAFPKG